MLFILAAILSQRWSSATEEELLLEFKEQGTMGCLGELYKRYSGQVYAVCLKYLKDRDAAQDAVMEVWEKLTKELRKREIDRFGAWLHVITRNHCLMQLRSQKSNASDSFSEINGHVVESAMAVHPIGEPDETEEQLQRLEQAIEGLSEEQRQCVSLFYLQKKSYQEVAELTGFELKKVKSYIQNGKRNLRLALERTHE